MKPAIPLPLLLPAIVALTLAATGADGSPRSITRKVILAS